MDHFLSDQLHTVLVELTDEDYGSMIILRTPGYRQVGVANYAGVTMVNAFIS